MQLFTVIVFYLLLALVQSSLVVHLVPHSHDDAGWLRTVDEYYYDSVKQIYEKMVKALQAGRDRRFIIVEQIYFKRWFQHASQEQRESFVQLLENGQVEFVSGGWVMHDEATVTAISAIDQLSLGLRYINSTFGSKYLPETGYQIDPFGHSAATPIISTGIGYKNIVLNRIHYLDKAKRQERREMLFNWRARSRDNHLLSHILDEHYSSPPRFDFEVDPSIGDEEDLKKKSQWLINHWLERSKRYPDSGHFLQLLGDDFKWRDPFRPFENWERLIEYINSSQDQVQVRFSLLSEYFQSVRESQVALSEYDGDFHPYADNEWSYWTGYYTSKPALKQLVRDSENLKHMSEITSIQRLLLSDHLEKEFSKIEKRLESIAEANAEIQHHDAVTGTAKEYVSQNYIGKLNRARRESVKLIGENLNKVLLLTDNMRLDEDYDNLETLETGESVRLVLYDTDYERTRIVKLPVPSKNFAIFDMEGGEINSQAVPRYVSYDLKHGSPYHLYFEVRDLKLFSPNLFLIRKVVTKKLAHTKHLKCTTLQNKHLKIDFNHHHCHHEHSYLDSTFKVAFTDRKSHETVYINPHFMQYKSYTGPGQSSGAYIFRPTGPATHIERPFKHLPKLEVVAGPLVQEVRVMFSPSFHQIYRLFNTEGFQGETVELVNIVGPIKSDSEIVVRMNGPKNNQSDDECVLETDDMGMVMMKREAPGPNIARNFYPITSAASLKCGEDRYLTVFTDRSMAAGSQKSGELELLVHRRISKDDARGVDEPLQDETQIETSFHLHFSASKKSRNQNSQDIFRGIWTKKHSPIVLLAQQKYKPRSKPVDIASSTVDENEIPYLASMQILSASESTIKVLMRVQDFESKNLNALIDLFKSKQIKRVNMKQVSLAGTSLHYHDNIYQRQFTSQKLGDLHNIFRRHEKKYETCEVMAYELEFAK